jgi:predicted membrane channel-forming protein YqfA (hemolysin III family)
VAVLSPFPRFGSFFRFFSLVLGAVWYSVGGAVFVRFWAV